jgi:hypothetical protein
MYPPPVKGRIVTVRFLPKRMEEVKPDWYEFEGPVLPFGHNHELISDRLFTYSTDRFAIDTLELAMRTGKSVSVTVRDLPAGWQIESCSL